MTSDDVEAELAAVKARCAELEKSNMAQAERWVQIDRLLDNRAKWASRTNLLEEISAAMRGWPNPWIEQELNKLLSQQRSRADIAEGERDALLQHNADLVKQLEEGLDWKEEADRQSNVAEACREQRDDALNIAIAKVQVELGRLRADRTRLESELASFKVPSVFPVADLRSEPANLGDWLCRFPPAAPRWLIEAAFQATIAAGQWRFHLTHSAPPEILAASAAVQEFMQLDASRPSPSPATESNSSEIPNSSPDWMQQAAGRAANRAVNYCLYSTCKISECSLRVVEIILEELRSHASAAPAERDEHGMTLQMWRECARLADGWHGGPVRQSPCGKKWLFDGQEFPSLVAGLASWFKSRYGNGDGA